MLHSTFAKRFSELAQAFAALKFHQSDRGMSGLYVDTGDWMRWATSAQNLILAVYGESSPHYTNFVEVIKKCVGYEDDVLTLRGIFLSAKDDFEGGYVFNVDLRISGEVLGDFVSLAKEALAEGHKDVAAVLACASLEDALKRFATLEGHNVDGKTMQEVVNLLKAKGLVSGAQKTILDTLPRVRNYALHAEWAKLTEPEVSSVIGFVEQFLLTRFGEA